MAGKKLTEMRINPKKKRGVITSRGGEIIPVDFKKAVKLFF